MVSREFSRGMAAGLLSGSRSVLSLRVAHVRVCLKSNPSFPFIDKP
jgi:hypothetical protein